MPIYQLSPQNKQVLQAVPGLPTYLLGSLNRLVAPTRMKVTAVASNGATLTYTVAVIEGQLPVAGQLVSIAGCTTNSQFNVTNAAIASVSFTDVPEDGIGTISVTQAGSFYATTADVGAGIAPQIELGETIGNLSVNGGPFASQEVALQDNTGPDNAFTIRAVVNFPVLPGAAVVSLQTADLNIDSDYITLGSVVSVSGGVLDGVAGSHVDGQIWAGIRARFVRFLVNGLAASSAGKIIAKVTI